MRLTTLRYRPQRPDIVGEGPRSHGATGEQIRVLSVRLEELQESVKELYRLLEKLESGLQRTDSAHASWVEPHPTQVRSRVESDYWLG